MSSEAAGPDFVILFQAWFEKHKQKVIRWSIVVAVAAVVTYIYLEHKSQKAQEASVQLLNLLPVINQAEGKSIKPEELLKVTEAFPDTPSGEQALILAAGELVKSGKYQEAQGKFEQFLTQYPGSSFAATASLGVAVCLDAQNDLDKAIAAYKKVIDGYSSDSAAGEAKIALGVIYQTKGQLADALKIYTELANNPNSMWAREAELHRRLLTEAHPELAVTNAVMTPLAPKLISTNAPKTTTAPAQSQKAPSAPAKKY